MKTKINKVISVVIVLAMVLSQMAFMSFATSGVTPVSITAVKDNPLYENYDGYNYRDDWWDDPDYEGAEYFRYDEDMYLYDAYDTFYADYTVTMSDGSTISGGEWQIENELNVDVQTYSDQSCENQWGVGTHTATVEMYSYDTGETLSCDLEIVIIENPVANVAVEPITLIENTNGYWDERYNSEIGDYEPYYHYHVWEEDFNFTVTLKDGTVLTSDYNGVVKIGEGYYVLDCLINQYDTPFTLGENEIKASCLGVETTAVVEIIECPVASIEFEPVTLIENANGEWFERYNYETGEYEDYFYYSYETNYTVTLKDGTVLKSDSYGEIEYLGQYYYPDYEVYQNDEPFELGINERTVSIMGYETTQKIEIIETPIASIDLEPIVFVENTDGSWGDRYNEETEEYEEYFNYDMFMLDWNYTVTLKDGRVLTSNDDGAIPYNGNWYSVVYKYDSWDYQRENPFVLGENKFPISVLGYETDAMIEVVDTPIASIDIIPYRTIENTEGYWSTRYNSETGEDEPYYYYQFWNIDWEYTVTLIDGTVLESDYDGQILYDGNWYDLEVSVNQSETPLTVGTHEIDVSILGYETTATFEIIECPIESVEIEPIAKIENTDGDWNYIYDPDSEPIKFFYYEIWGSDFEYTATLKDGTVLTSEYGSVEYDGREYYLDLDLAQYSNPLKLGENTCEATIMGYPVTVTIEILECPVASVDIEPGLILENYNGYWNDRYNEETGEYEEYFYYWLSTNDFDYTVTLKDGTVLTAYDGWVDYNNESYGLDFDVDQSETPLVLGENTINVSILGYETTAILEITDTPVASIEINPITIMENTDGQWEERYNEETGNYEDFYYYNSWYFDWEYTVTLKDGTVLESDSDGDIYYNDRWYDLELLIDQYNNPLTVGENEVTVSILGYETTAIIEIIESPVASIEVKPVTFIENTNGYWDTSWYDDETYYYYELYGNDFEYTVTLKDGTVLNSNYGYVDYNGEEYYLNIHTSQEVNHFTLGENEIEVSVLGGSTTAIVEIIESPVASIEVEPLTYIEYTNGYWEEEYNSETEEWEPLYYSYYVSSYRFDITVNLKDGTVLKANDGYIEYNGKEYYIETSSNQSENPFTLGKNQVTVSVMGCDTIAIVEIIESPVERIEAEPVTITEYTNGDWNYMWNDFDVREYYYRYAAENIVDFKVVLKDGTVLTPYTDNWGDTYIQYMGAEYGVSLSTDQYMNHWSVGTHTVEIEALGTTGTAEIKIVSENNCPYGYDEIDGGVVITGVNDTSAERVEIPEEINGKAVVGIASLGTPYATEIIVPDSVKFLSKTWLYNCVSATSVTLGKSVQQLSADMFATAFSLESINISAENPNFKSIDGVAYTKDGSTLVAFPLGKGDTYTVPAGVSNIDVIFENSIYRDLNITFTDDSDGFVTVDGVTYNSDMTTVIYCNPSKTGAYTMPDTVTEIYERAFAESGIESVKISKNVNEIVYGAFADCSSLQSVEIPDSVQSIGKQAFVNCDALENITLPESLTSIGDSAFEDSDALTEISIPGGVMVLGKDNFRSCDSLRKATLKKGIETIDWGVFEYCVALEEVSLPDTLKEIKEAAFCYCESLKEITLPDSLETIGLFVFNFTGLTSIVIPDSVTTLEASFEDCGDLATVQLSSSIKEIDSNCFQNCYSLTSIVIPAGVERIGYYAFSNCISLVSVNIPDSVEYVDACAFLDTAYANNAANYENGILYIGKALYTTKPEISGDIVVKAGTKSITTEAFWGSDISSVVLPEGLEYIGDYAFQGCYELTNIGFPSTLKEIEYATFRGCEKLSSVEFAEGLEYIGNHAFEDCYNLTSVTFPSTLKVIDANAFEGCSKLSDVEFPEGLKVIGYGAFYGTAIESIKIPSTVTDIVYGAFADSNITDIDMPDNVISMDGNTLSGTPWHETQDEGVVYAENVLYGYKGTMPENTTITVKEGTLSIAGYAFDSETNLTGITFADTVGLIGKYAFYRCKGLETVTLPASVKTIEYEAFAHCSSLKTVVLGSGLETIEYGAFAGCSSLENISLGGVKDIGYGAFRGCSSLTSIYIPASVEEISENAFAGCSSLAEINVDADNKYYSSIDGILYNKEGTEVIYCPTAKTGVITLGLDVERVADYAFSTSKVTKIIVENTELEIGSNAFATANGEYRGEINAILLCAATGSTTEAYAESSGQPFEVKGEAVLTDGETEITIEKEDNSAFENIVLNVDLLSMVEDEVVYDITLTNNGVEVQPDGAVIVKIPVPATMDPEQIKVYHLSENGNYTNMNAEYIDGYMVFTTDHFSQYVLTTEEKVTVLLGDVNGDGKLSAIDARWTLQYSAGNREFTAEQIAAADANGDGKVSAIDARWILQASAGNRVL